MRKISTEETARKNKRKRSILGPINLVVSAQVTCTFAPMATLYHV